MEITRESASEPVVLVTNDDGIESPGLLALAVALDQRGLRVLVAAPERDMSGSAAAIGPVDPTIPIRRVELDGFGGQAFAVSAPPAMIVIAALGGAFDSIPTAVASGVNAGVNLGRAILHSGTVGAALTAQNLGLAAVAISVEDGADLTIAADAGVDILVQLIDSGASAMANVNVARTASATTDRVTTQLSRFGATTAAITGDVLDFQLTIDPEALAEPGSDAGAIRDGLISVTWLNGFAGTVSSDPGFTLLTR